MHDQFCTCAAWKWSHEKHTYVIRITDDKKAFKKDFRNDKNIAIKLHGLMTEADVIVAHNGDRFDIKHANSLFIKHGLGPIPKNKSIDTLKVAKKYFAFPGNSLDNIAKRFGSEGKNQKPDWYKMTDGDSVEIERAAVYCKNDVRILEKIFIEMRPFIQNFPMIKSKHICPETKDPLVCSKCNSHWVIRSGKSFQASGIYQRFKCRDCDSWMIGGKIE